MSDFILFYGELVDRQQEEIGIALPEVLPIKIFIDSCKVVAVRESFDKNAELNGSIVYMSSGDDFWVEDDVLTVLHKLNVNVINEGAAVK